RNTQPPTRATPRRPYRHQPKQTETQPQKENQVQQPTTPPNRLKLKLAETVGLGFTDDGNLSSLDANGVRTNWTLDIEAALRHKLGDR
ncbi:hypothetical protein, partial [Amycolatopsis sp. NPDC051071]|uniref:hypothetical protein n=1 Tax=Amycolatopsis sp. NPDC051071 TaxID=3154637 RepID=UPI00341EBBAF